jgi:hypothetical protein
MGMTAIQAFDQTMKRAVAQLNLYLELADQFRLTHAEPSLSSDPKCSPETMTELDDLVRTSLVLAVSAFDAYFTDKFVESIVPFLKRYKATDELVDLLSRAGLDTRTALDLIQMDRPYRRVRALLNRHLETYVTQRLEVIDGLFLTIGLKNLSKNAQAKTGRKQLCKNVQHAIDRRHRIVHAGDLNDRGKVCPVGERQIARRLECLAQFVHSSDEIIDHRLGT